MALKRRDQYYIVFMYNNYKLILILNLIEKFDLKLKFQPYWP